jgi:predicted nucleotidyltransferase
VPRNPKADPILSRFRAALDKIYGDRLERVVLYGSRACGDERPDSDYDIAVFIDDPDSLGDELHRLSCLTTDILVDTGAVISALPFRAGAYREHTGFMHELRNVVSPAPGPAAQPVSPTSRRAKLISPRLPCSRSVHLRAHRQGR